MAKTIVVGAAVRQDAAVLAAHLKTLRALEAPNGYQIVYAFVDDNDEESDLLCAMDAVVLRGDARSSDAHYAVGAQTHEWQLATFEHLARQKQKLLQHALRVEADAVMLIDSDLLVDPMTLKSLWATKAPVVSAVFWTPWQVGAQPMPQVWMRHPYEFDGLGYEAHEFMLQLANRQVLRVAGGGACTLIRRSALVAGAAYHPRLEGLPDHSMWQGEDRSFAIRLERLRVRQYADAWPTVYHAYHPHDRTQAALDGALAQVLAPKQMAAKAGDWVSAVIEPLEDAPLQDILTPEVRTLRGRLGGMSLLPELEAALSSMTVGEQRMVELRFPQWWPLRQYANTKRLVELTLVDVKPDDE